MSNAKNFGELSIDDVIYFRTPSQHGSESITELKREGRTKITIFTDAEEEYLVPRDECYYKRDEDLELTTDPELLKEWRKPFIETQIKQKHDRIKELYSEIVELSNSAGIPAPPLAI